MSNETDKDFCGPGDMLVRNSAHGRLVLNEATSVRLLSL